MISVLIVDDTPEKTKSIREVVCDVVEHETVDVNAVSSVAEAVRFLKTRQVDLLILDLHLPIRAGEDPKSDGGARLLDAITSLGAVGKPAHIIGLTAFSTLLDQYRDKFEAETWSIVEYTATSVDWAKVLRKRVEYIVDRRLANGFRIDLAIVTALERPEMEAVLNLPADWKSEKIASDDTRYFRGEFRRDQNSLSCVAACCLDMGMPAATALTTKMIYEFRPRHVAMVGIAAGVTGNYGDILVASQSYDYGSGKSIQRFLRGVQFQPAPIAIQLSASMKAKLGAFSRRDEVAKRIQNGWSGQRTPWDLAIMTGPVASGAAVLENRPLIQQIKSHDRKLIGIEMETYGVFTACRCCSELRPTAVSIKSICDFGDTRKNNAYQGYAAYTSASYLFEFALAELSLSGNRNSG